MIFRQNGTLTHDFSLFPSPQIDALKAAGCEKWFVDKITGSQAERRGLNEALAYVRPGDTFMVWK